MSKYSDFFCTSFCLALVNEHFLLEFRCRISALFLGFSNQSIFRCLLPLPRRVHRILHQSQPGRNRTRSDPFSPFCASSRTRQWRCQRLFWLSPFSALWATARAQLETHRTRHPQRGTEVSCLDIAQEEPPCEELPFEYLKSRVHTADPMENWLINDMIGRTGLVDSFNVSLSTSFIRKKRSFLPDEARTERNVETVNQFCPTNHVIGYTTVSVWRLDFQSMKLTVSQNRSHSVCCVQLLFLDLFVESRNWVL